MTIRVLGLCRNGLAGARRDHLLLVRDWHQIVTNAVDNPGDLAWASGGARARQRLVDAQLPNAPFSSMVIDFMAGNPL